MALQPLKLMFIYALIVFCTVQHLRCTHSLLLNGRGEDTQGKPALAAAFQFFF